MAAADTARRLIAKHGRRDGQLERPSTLEVPASPSQPWKPVQLGTEAEVDQLLDALEGAGTGAETEGEPSDEPFDVVVLDASSFKKDQLTPETTAVAYVAALALSSPPKVGDRLLTRGERYHVLRADDLAPGVGSILYTLHLKG